MTHADTPSADNEKAETLSDESEMTPAVSRAMLVFYRELVVKHRNAAIESRKRAEAAEAERDRLAAAREAAQAEVDRITRSATNHLLASQQADDENDKLSASLDAATAEVETLKALLRECHECAVHDYNHSLDDALLARISAATGGPA